MSSQRHPEREIRDALGFVRLLYAARRERGRTSAAHDDPLVAIGRELVLALRLARSETAAERRDAIERAQLALHRLADEVTMGDAMANVARVALARVTGQPFRKGVKIGR